MVPGNCHQPLAQVQANLLMPLSLRVPLFLHGLGAQVYLGEYSVTTTVVFV